MKQRMAIITEIIAPYRVPVFNALARNPAIEPYIIFLSETDSSLRQWPVYKDELQFRYRVLPNWRRRVAGYNLLLNKGLYRELERVSPQTVICGGYNYLASWQAAFWCEQHNVPLVLWTESTAYDRRHHWPVVERLKRRFLRCCDACVVPGRSAFEYLSALQVPARIVVTAPDAVDNKFFATAAEAARAQAAFYRQQRKLPDRFFLCAGRLIAAKGVFDLIEAYAGLAPDIRSQVGLVFAGNGVAQSELQRRATRISPGRIQFAGFLEREELAIHYGLADVLVFPTRTDPWGLVVNEAMACGLPVITTSVAGCAADLVEDGENGFVVRPGAVGELLAAMDLLARDCKLRQRFAARSAEKIRNNSPEACAQGLANAAAFAATKVANG